MAFREIRKNEIGEGTPSITLGSCRRPGKSRHSQMVLNLSSSLAEFIRVKPGDRISLSIGTLADRGWAKIQRGAEHKTSEHGHPGSIRVRFSGRRFGVDQTHSPQQLRFKLGENHSGPFIVFLLPKWARKDIEGDD